MAGYKGSRINPRNFNKDQLPIYIILLPLAIFMLFPLVFIFCHAFKPMSELFKFPPSFFVERPVMDNFENLLKSARNSSIPIGRYIFNSFLVTIAVILANIIISTMAGFALSKMKFKLRGPLFAINQAALMFVATAVQIPRYLIISNIHITDTYFAHILPLIAAPTTLFLIKQFIDDVPDSLIEAAVVDGANSFRIYSQIIIPLIKPAIATGVILSFQQVWGYLESSNLYTNTESMKTLVFYMNTLANANNGVQGQGVQAAATLILFVPNLIIFLFLQKDVMNTMAHSGIK
ncbi:MAG: carbohydrate ABC transporter permease [Lachnospiraceae bacterium]|nr:carbohydrate ABC transporter permease [Lachnospiraceae bacterium]